MKGNASKALPSRRRNLLCHRDTLILLEIARISLTLKFYTLGVYRDRKRLESGTTVQLLYYLEESMDHDGGRDCGLCHNRG